MYKCKLCSYSTPSKYSIEEHIRRHRPSTSSGGDISSPLFDFSSSYDCGFDFSSFSDSFIGGGGGGFGGGGSSSDF